MNAVEKLEAAIAKLEALHEASTKPTGAAHWYQGRERKRDERHTEVYSGPDERTPGSQEIVNFAEPEDAELVVVLHRTIEPQLAILRASIEAVQDWLDPDSRIGWEPQDGPHPNGPAFAAVLALADAILGVSDADVG